MIDISTDCFPCLLITTQLETNELIYSNHFAQDFLGILPDKSISLFDVVSKATSIFFESYISPMLLSHGECKEIQITLIASNGAKLPAVANIASSGERIYWAIFLAEERDKFYQELLVTRESLERQNEKLLDLTRVDPLTSLLNRRATIDDFYNIIKQLKRVFVPVSCVIIDIDFFKKINDGYGHNEGDKIIRALSAKLKESARDSDIVARWGGEEFLMLLYNSNASNTKIFCERLHKKINLIKLPDSKSLTVSIGVTELKENELGLDKVFDRIIKRSDDALYFAKMNGRNCTKLY
ncbi:GGDEF domain-containing protein [Colwellia sp. MEBiC06753]